MNQVHLWWESFDRTADARLETLARDLLPVHERTACERFLFDAGRRECLAARCMVRLLLSRYRSVPPRDWQFSTNEHGRPEIELPVNARGLRFNLSHADRVVACVVSAGADVGVDVEHTGRRTPLSLADSHFAPAERRAIATLPGSERPRRFLEYWTLKEAYIKARGTGLSLPLEQFAFDVDAPGPPTIRFAPDFDDDPANWQFDQAALGEGHLVAVATRLSAAERMALVTRRFDLATWPC